AIVAHGAHVLDGPVRTGAGAESAIEFLIRSDGHTSPRQACAQREDPAVRAAHEHSSGEEQSACDEHLRLTGAAEEADEGIEPADWKFPGQRRPQRKE